MVIPVAWKVGFIIITHFLKQTTQPGLLKTSPDRKILTTSFSVCVYLLCQAKQFLSRRGVGENAIILGQNSFLCSLHTTQYFSWFVKHVVAALQIQTSRRGYLEKTLRGCHGAYPIPGVKCHPVSQSREPAHGTVPRKEGFFSFKYLMCNYSHLFHETVFNSRITGMDLFSSSPKF